MGNKVWSQAIITAAVVLLLLVCLVKISSDAFQNNRCSNCWENFSDNPTRCFSCEKDIIQYAWMGQKTKTFDSEKDLIQRTGNPEAAFGAHPIKYY